MRGRGRKERRGKEQLCAKAFQTASKIAFALRGGKHFFIGDPLAFLSPFVFKPFFEKTGLLQGFSGHQAGEEVAAVFIAGGIRVVAFFHELGGLLCVRRRKKCRPF